MESTALPPALSAPCVGNAGFPVNESSCRAGNAFGAKADASSSTLLLAASKMSQLTGATSLRLRLVACPFTMRYIASAVPILQPAPPRGEQWLHEVKFDGWRIQLHKRGDSATAFTKNGHDHSSRVRWMVDGLARLTSNVTVLFRTV